MKRKEIAEMKARAPYRKMIRRIVWPLVALVSIAWFVVRMKRTWPDIFAFLSVFPFLIVWALMLLFPNDVTFEDQYKKAKGRVNVNISLLLFACYANMRLTFHRIILDWPKLLCISAPVLLLMLAGFLLRAKKEMKKTWMIAMVVLLLAVYCPALVGLSNITFDANPPQQISTPILHKSSRHVRRSGTNYYFGILIEDEKHSLQVYGDEYRQYEEGDEVEIDLYSGAFGIGYARLSQ